MLHKKFVLTLSLKNEEGKSIHDIAGCEVDIEVPDDYDQDILNNSLDAAKAQFMHNALAIRHEELPDETH